MTKYIIIGLQYLRLIFKPQFNQAECVVPKNIDTPTAEGHWKFRGGGGLKGRIFKGMCGPKLEFP